MNKKGHNLIILGCLKDETPQKQRANLKLSECENVKKNKSGDCMWVPHNKNNPHMVIL